MRSIIKLSVIFLIMFMVTVTGCRDDKKDTLTEIGASDSEKEEKPEREVKKETESAESVKPVQIYVYVCGQVNNPGVYQFTDGSRVFEAIEAAGGTTIEASPESLNYAACLTDGQKIYVPSQQETEEGLPSAQETTGTKGLTEDGLVDLNTAVAEELMTLPGIGKAKAAGIIAYREEHGRFESVEELMQVEGIKSAVYEKVKMLITVH